jgi:L-iditol 2-dehydrogenase
MEMAQVLGANTVLSARAGNEATDVLRACGNDGADVVFEAAGDNEAVETAIEVVRPGGRVVLIGIPDDDRTSFPASVARRKGLTIAMVRRMKHTYPRAINLVAGGLVDVRSIVSHRFSLQAYQQAFDTAEAREGIKVVIEPGGGADDLGATV